MARDARLVLYPTYPMQHVGLDLFSFGNHQYLICVDHRNGYPLYSPLRSLSSDTITSTLSSWFNILGWPSSIRSDGGPQFCCPFSSFCSQHGIKHELSAPYNRQYSTNGGISLAQMVSAPLSSFSDAANAHPCLYSPFKMSRSIFTTWQFRKTNFMPHLGHSMISIKFRCHS